MNPVRKRRLTIIVVLLAGFSVAVALVLVALQENMNLFYSPAEIAAGKAPVDQRIRAGGLVEQDSVKRDSDSLRVHFRITDNDGRVRVQYDGILPDLFREGQGVVALGKLNQNGVLVADQVLAKHDEEYMPPEVEQALKDAGRLKEGSGGGYYPKGEGESPEQQGDGA
jgi:cytochrome c-type biogenesis protein CcmE